MEWTPDRIRVFHDAGLCLSQLQFAKELGFDKRTIGNAERGAHPPSLALRRALDQALERASDAQRNRFLAAVTALEENCGTRDSKAWRTLTTSVENSSFGWFRVQSLLPTATRAVGMTDVRIIREMTQKFRNLDNRFGGGHARSAVTNYLATSLLVQRA